MRVQAGSRLGPYEVVSSIGAGGMGEVFKARDTRLDRSVAIKVLPAEFAENAQLRARFQREAQAISQLTHPNICTLYDVGTENGVEYLVMELIDGVSLADMLSRGALPLDQVLRYSIDIAQALDRAHKAGIVHRDLKPGNVMITRSGAKLLDFGLATVDSRRPAMPVSEATVQKPLTTEGMVVGTFQYMAPEQVAGEGVDARSDIFAFGALMYEMATGKRAFDGKTRTSVIAAIIERDPPPISQLQPLTPAAFERVVTSCLAKHPDDRWQSAHDILLQLQWIDAAGTKPSAIRKPDRQWLGWAIAALLLVATATLATLWYRNETRPKRRIETTIQPPPNGTFNFFLGSVAISPDGRRLIYAATVDHVAALWLRSLDSAVAQPLQGTESARYPFWSPDGRSIAFFAAGKLKRLDLSGGGASTICDASSGRGGSWGTDGFILFTPDARSPILRVPANGGTPAAVTRFASAGEYSHRWPSFLPDGKHFVYMAQGDSAAEGRGRIYVGELGSFDRKPIVDSPGPAIYSKAGYLLFYRDHALMAQAFDVDRQRVSGEPLRVAERIEYFSGPASATFSVSEDGTLVYAQGDSSISRLIVRDRNGRELGTVGRDGDLQRARVSHDGGRIVYEVVDDKLDTTDLWIADVEQNTATRLTFGNGAAMYPVWSGDDKWIIYTRVNSASSRDIVRKLATGAGQPEIIVPTQLASIGITDLSRDDRYAVANVVAVNGPTTADIWLIDLQAGKLAPLIATDATEGGAQISPDRRWVAYYSSTPSGSEVFIQAFPSPAGKWQVSTEGGALPRWSADGKELFFLSGDTKIVAAPVGSVDAIQVGRPVALFDAHPKGGSPFDVFPDGKRFLTNTLVQEDVMQPVTIVQNWAAGLR